MPDDDVATSLGELERKLEALELELQGSRQVSADPAPGVLDAGHDGIVSSGSARQNSGTVAPPAPPVAPEPPRPAYAHVASPPAPPRPSARLPAPEPEPELDSAGPSPEAALLIGDARAELGGLHAHLDELVRFREQLERSAAELMAEYDRLLTGLRAAAEREAAEVGVAAGLDGVKLDGLLTVDAGPFTSMTSLAELEQALGALPGVRDVHVRTFERSRACIDVILGEPLAFGAGLRRVSALDFSVLRAVPGQATLEMH